MKLRDVITGALLVATVACVRAGQYDTGKLIPEIQCRHAQAQSYSYMLYLPSGYTPDREVKWPVLFVMGPEGGTEDGIRRYIKGAEMNNWIVAMSIQSKNGFKASKTAVAAMVGDVFKRFAVDKERCYATGMSGGARLAFWLANEREQNIIGIIPCGAGDAGNRYSSRAFAYGLCGGYCFNRWDMTITFNRRILNRGRLRFFEGGHVWPDEGLLFDAMTWLNGKYLAKKGTPEEINRFSEMLFNEILDQYEDNPVFTYENAVVLAGVPKAPHADQAMEIADKLATEPGIKLYIQGLKEMDEFVDKHFNTEINDRRNNRLTRKQKEDADALLKKYELTPLAKTIEDFGKPSRKL